ncbi:hypothetical protein SAMD00019534_100080 [Acytostelium subglobosum LB1]|uniref:hypothetical protein n=1 Tax=Acytostelium subglobosum LB1 TaxID=1410327 RepID=UPI00064505F3|nr:hypothetical protein SAMD00019534_100080 [Acytostelium subglobosum LB1]GAM26833.1 hypothetical protein SAMD00019534_100080 [Acytostelium subglobosum LB1]|eukprot:XP_012750101.1 hypothetical protein SAMD00019534_100080 [Acytostelium subglobosum LB1]
MKKGDWLIYYSPRETMETKSKALKSFTAIGEVADDEVYQFKMTDTFIPFRRRVNYIKQAITTSIIPLLPLLSFTKDRQSSWGVMFRNGLFEINEQDFKLIRDRMIVVCDKEEEEITSLDVSNVLTESDEQCITVERPTKRLRVKVNKEEKDKQQ